MDKSIADVYLMEIAATRVGKSEHKTHCGWFDYRRECFRVIKPVLLSEAARDEPCPELVEGAICLMLHFEDPFAAYNIFAGRLRHQ